MSCVKTYAFYFQDHNIAIIWSIIATKNIGKHDCPKNHWLSSGGV